MGTNTKIRLPLGTHSQDILLVTGRCMGAAMVPQPLTPHADTTQLSSENNRWAYVLNDGDFSVEMANSKRLMGAYGELHFAAFKKVNYEWYLHMEDENEEHVLLNPGSHPVAIAMGCRLVDFFGGTVQYNDSNERINRRVPVEKSLFARHRKTDDSRLDALTNALRETGPLLSKEILRTYRWAAYQQEDEIQQILEECRKYERQAWLESSLPAPTQHTRAPRF